MSDLQKNLLRLAAARQPRQNGVAVYSHEALVALWGWPAWVSYTDTPSRQRFSMATIGERTYRTAHAILSRALTRLERRGLVTVYQGAVSRWAGFALTEPGRALADKLSANTVAN